MLVKPSMRCMIRKSTVKESWLNVPESAEP